MKSPKELLQTMLSKVGDGTSSATVEILKELVTIQLDEAGTLSTRIGDDKKLAISRMKVNGALDSSDVKCLDWRCWICRMRESLQAAAITSMSGIARTKKI